MELNDEGNIMNVINKEGVGWREECFYRNKNYRQ